MSVYGNSLINNESYFIRSEKEKELYNNWDLSKDGKMIRIYNNDTLSEDDYNELFELNYNMKNCEKYDEYKKYFKEFCNKIHISTEGVTIRYIKIKSGDTKNNNHISVGYYINTKKIKIPNGISLYHITKVGGIKALNPTFRSKATTGYLYSSPRVYLTLHKYMPKFLADYDNNDKMYKYEVIDNISEVYVDPMIKHKFQGAVYVETNTPIRVKELK